jgi:hypothetical protein
LLSPRWHVPASVHRSVAAPLGRPQCGHPGGVNATLADLPRRHDGVLRLDRRCGGVRAAACARPRPGSWPHRELPSGVYVDGERLEDADAREKGSTPLCRSGGGAQPPQRIAPLDTAGARGCEAGTRQGSRASLARRSTRCRDDPPSHQVVNLASERGARRCRAGWRGLSRRAEQSRGICSGMRALSALGWLVLRFSYWRIHDEPDVVRNEIPAVLDTRRRQLAA